MIRRGNYLKWFQNFTFPAPPPWSWFGQAQGPLLGGQTRTNSRGPKAHRVWWFFLHLKGITNQINGRATCKVGEASGHRLNIRGEVVTPLLRAGRPYKWGRLDYEGTINL